MIPSIFNRAAQARALSRAASGRAHGWGHGFIHGERQGTCGGAQDDDIDSQPVAIAEEVARANRKGISQWEIRDTGDKGYGIYSKKSFAPQEVLFRATCLQETSTRTSHSVQTDWNRHVFMDLPARFINHSCEANVGIRDNELGAFDFIALSPIAQGEELTWDYGGSEFESISIERCLCGTPSCRGQHLGFRDSYRSIRQQYAPLYAKYLHGWTSEENEESS